MTKTVAVKVVLKEAAWNALVDLANVAKMGPRDYAAKILEDAAAPAGWLLDPQEAVEEDDPDCDC